MRKPRRWPSAVWATGASFGLWPNMASTGGGHSATPVPHYTFLVRSQVIFAGCAFILFGLVLRLMLQSVGITLR
jgi:hypothetical protein